MRRHGFTLIEVMMALAVLTIGAGALIGTQTLSSRTNMQARQMTIATEIAQTWAERLKLDAVTWTDGAAGIASTTWLRDSTGPAMNTWINPQTILANAAPIPTRSFVFDRYGRDIPLGTTATFYCVAYRFNWVVAPAANTTPAMRVDIRVFWPRENRGTAPSCTLPAGLNPALFHSVGLPIVVKQTALPNP